MITKKIILLLPAIFLCRCAFAQDEKIFNKLNTLYTLDKYEECIKKANDYITGSKTSKDAYPYLYMSMCYFSIYQNLDHYDAKSYRDPLRKSLSYAARFIKRDKQEQLKSESADFLDQLHRAVLRELAYMNKNNDAKGLQSLTREVLNDYPKDYAMRLAAGTYLYYGGVKSEGDKAVEGALDSLKKAPALTDTLFQKDYVNAFVLYTNYLLENKETAKAKTVLNEAMNLCPGSDELKNVADRINNGEPAKPSH